MADGEADSSIGLAAEGEHEFVYAGKWGHMHFSQRACLLPIFPFWKCLLKRNADLLHAEQQETAVVEHPAEEQELGQEGEQPGITAIEDPAGAAQADEGSNTVSNTEQQSNIESYTGCDNSPREEEQQQPSAQVRSTLPRVNSKHAQPAPLSFALKFHATSAFLSS